MDTSVINRMDKPSVRQRLERIALADRCVNLPVILEYGFSARSTEDYVRRMRSLSAAFQEAHMFKAAQRRAVEVQALLARRGHQRAAGIADLMIGATAEVLNLTVLHYDKDFDLIAAVTGQSVEWVVPAGTADA